MCALALSSLVVQLPVGSLASAAGARQFGCQQSCCRDTNNFALDVVIIALGLIADCLTQEACLETTSALRVAAGRSGCQCQSVLNNKRV